MVVFPPPQVVAELLVVADGGLGWAKCVVDLPVACEQVCKDEELVAFKAHVVDVAVQPEVSE